MPETGTGIIGYGASVPRYRITVEEIAKVWGGDAASIKRGLGLKEKSVPGRDQDVITMSVAASKSALRQDGVRLTAQLIDLEGHVVRTGMPVQLELRRIQQDGRSSVIGYGYKAVPAE